jgi:hypothetical protein
MRVTVACADVGSIAEGRFGWAIRQPPEPLIEVEHHGSIEALGNEVISRVNNGELVALGFECPLFVPIPDEPELLGKARPGEGNGPWSAGAGTGALATGLVQSTWLLRHIRCGLKVDPTATLDWDVFADGKTPLFLWEAFVSRKAKSGSDHGDAAAAVMAFCNSLPNPQASNAIGAQIALSLIGAALLRSGWDVSAEVLKQPCLVIEATAEVARQ